MNERLKNFISWLIKTGKISNQSDFALRMDMKSTGQLSSLLNGRRPISPKFVRKIAEVFPDLNPLYLIDDNCIEMLRALDNSVTGDFSKNVSSSIHVSQSEELAAIVRKQQEQIDRLLSIIEKLTK